MARLRQAKGCEEYGVAGGDLGLPTCGARRPRVWGESLYDVA